MDDRKAFQLAELSGRDKALKALNQISLLDDFNDYKVVPTSGWCKWDFEIRDNLTNELLGIVEAKDRKFDSTDKKLRYGGAQLEAMKYDALKKYATDNDITAFYLSTYTDDKFYIWDILNTPTTEDRRMCNKTTAVLSEKIEKHCHYFAMNKAKFIGNI